MPSLNGTKVAFTTRFGGVSKAAFSDFNLGDHVGDDPHAVAENRRILQARFGAPVLWMHQTHSDVVNVANSRDLVYEGDALVIDAAQFSSSESETTNEISALAPPAAAVMVADCVPILLASASGRVVAAVHAGRAGLEKRIIAKTVRVMQDIEDVPVSAAIGPHICGRCYEVPLSLQAQLVSVTPQARAVSARGTPALNLGAAAREQLREVHAKIQFQSNVCTKTSSKYFSYRRQKQTGRFVGIIGPTRRIIDKK
ncbi:MAG: peptidoglycan editing factor PgeF [Actinomycetaceae bacterium]|nr:peptidoglycan editing factor PgeF [Actinomycetaceae bacterium]